MSQVTYTPSTANAPYGNKVANPQSANYITDSGYSATGNNLLQKAIKSAIFDASPEDYKALRLLFEKEMIEKVSDEFEFLEKTFGRTAVEATSAPVAVVASAGNEVTQVIAMTADSVTRIAVNDMIIYPDGTKAIVRTIATLNVTVASLTSVGLPAVAAGDVFAILGPAYADGQSDFSHYDRMSVVTRYNYLQRFLRADRWTRMELLKYQNAGTTDYLDVARAEKMEQLRVDLFVAYFNGTRGEVKLANGTPAKTMGGIFPTMVAAGVMSGNPTVAGLPSQFETLALKTNFKKKGSTRFLFGCEEMLYILSKSFKQEGVRYEPNSRIADLNLTEYKIGNQSYVPVSCELFREPSAFPAAWARRILCLDVATIRPVKMKGLPAFESGETLDKGKNGTREEFKDFWVGGNISQEFNNPQGCFYLDVQ
jgi:hypothetical protein